MYKTSEIVSEMATSQIEVIVNLQNRLFRLAMNGSNDSGSQQYPIVMKYFIDNVQVLKIIY